MYSTVREPVPDRHRAEFYFSGSGPRRDKMKKKTEKLNTKLLITVLDSIKIRGGGGQSNAGRGSQTSVHAVDRQSDEGADGRIAPRVHSVHSLSVTFGRLNRDKWTLAHVPNWGRTPSRLRWCRRRAGPHSQGSRRHPALGGTCRRTRTPG